MIYLYIWEGGQRTVLERQTSSVAQLPENKENSSFPKKNKKSLSNSLILNMGAAAGQGYLSSMNYQYVLTWSFAKGQKVSLANLGFHSEKK